ncbi:MAG TPA: hypothetical protein VGE72_17095 [Azospirillum sp.]
MNTGDNTINLRLFLLATRLYELLYAVVCIKLSKTIATDALDEALVIASELAGLGTRLTGQHGQEHRYGRNGKRCGPTSTPWQIRRTLTAVLFPSSTKLGRLLRSMDCPIPCTGDWNTDELIQRACGQGYDAGISEKKSSIQKVSPSDECEACPYEVGEDADVETACAFAWQAGRNWALYGSTFAMFEKMTDTLAKMGHPRHTLIQGGGVG